MFSFFALLVLLGVGHLGLGVVLSELIILLLQVLGSLNTILDHGSKVLGTLGKVSGIALDLLRSHLSLRGHLDLEEVLLSVLDLIELVEGEPSKAKGGKESVGLEEHGVLDNGVAGEGLPGGKGGDGNHGPSAVGDLELTHGLASDGVVAEGTVKAEGVKVVIAGNSVLPNILHVALVFLSELGADRVETERSLVLGIAKAGKDGGGGKEGDGVEAVEDRGGKVVGSLKHPVGSHELREGPADDGDHGKTGVADLGLHHGVKVEGLGKAEGVKTIVTGVGTIQLGRALEHGHGDGHLHVVVSATARAHHSVREKKKEREQDVLGKMK